MSAQEYISEVEKNCSVRSAILRIEEFRIIGFYLYHVTSIRPSNSIGASGLASLNIDYDRGSSS